MKNSRNTQAKAKIFEILSSSRVALSHQEIKELLDVSCDRVTIYRVLDRLSSEGKAHKVVGTDGVMRFALCKECLTEHHYDKHLHFSCEKCGAVRCLDEDVPHISINKKYKVTGVNIIVSGICPSCK
ncbi:MAG: transcriptional repressor [Melioribacteraceae bacterium]|nr:transcriptional repressor [Melioribacteraceae bacterium]